MASRTEKKDPEKGGWERLLDMAQKLLLIPGLQGMGREEREAVRDELELVRTSIVEGRPARIALFGRQDAPVERLVEALLGLAYFGDLEVKRHLGRHRWYDYENGAGVVRLLDGTGDGGDDDAKESILKALARERADMAIILCGPDDLADGPFRDDLDDYGRAMSENYGESVPTTVALTVPRRDDSTRARSQVRTELRRTGFGRHTVQLAPFYAPEELLERLVQYAPGEVRFELASVLPSRAAKEILADELTTAFTRVSAAMSALRLPVADVVPLTALQVGLVVAIAHLGGRTLTWTSATQFLVRLGFHVGAARTISRTAHRVARSVPVMRPFLSAGVSASTTQLIGAAAKRHFIGSR